MDTGNGRMGIERQFITVSMLHIEYFLSFSYKLITMHAHCNVIGRPQHIP